MKSSRFILGISLALFVLLAPALAQVRIVKAKVPFDFVVGSQILPAGEYRFALIGAGQLRILRTNGPEIADIIAPPVIGSEDAKPRLLFHRYGDHNFLAEVWVGEMGISHQLYTSASELEYAKTTRQGTTTILAAK